MWLAEIRSNQRLKPNAWAEGKAGLTVPELLFADDLSLLSNVHDQLQTMLNRLRVYAHRKSWAVNTHKSEVMCFSSRSDNRLPPLYYDGTQLSYTDTFKYLGMVCDKNINLITVADAALKFLRLALSK